MFVFPCYFYIKLFDPDAPTAISSDGTVIPSLTLSSLTSSPLSSHVTFALPSSDSADATPSRTRSSQSETLQVLLHVSKDYRRRRHYLWFVPLSSFASAHSPAIILGIASIIQLLIDATKEAKAPQNSRTNTTTNVTFSF